MGHWIICCHIAKLFQICTVCIACRSAPTQLKVVDASLHVTCMSSSLSSRLSWNWWKMLAFYLLITVLLSLLQVIHGRDWLVYELCRSSECASTQGRYSTWSLLHRPITTSGERNFLFKKWKSDEWTNEKLRHHRWLVTSHEITMEYIPALARNEWVSFHGFSYHPAKQSMNSRATGCAFTGTLIQGQQKGRKGGGGA